MTYRIVATMPDRDPVHFQDDSLMLTEIWRLTQGVAMEACGWTLSETETVDDASLPDNVVAFPAEDQGGRAA